MRRTHRSDRGTSIIELALILPLLTVIVLGVLDLGHAYRLQIRLEGAARAATQHAVLYPNEFDCTGTNDIIGEAEAAEPALLTESGYTISMFADDGAGNLTVPVTGCNSGTVGSGERVRVDVSAQYGILTPLIAGIVGNSVTVTGSAEVEALA